nr:DUF6708 domain-containing protein [Paraburkholderia sp. NMBU_R16]
MAFDGLSWYRLNRPVTSQEDAARLQIDQSCSKTATDGNTVFSISESCLEISDDNYREKGWGLLAFLIPGMGAFAATAFVLWVIVSPPLAVKDRGQEALILPLFAPLLLFMLCLCALAIWALTRDCFGYTRNPIRLNRINRTIYVFRRNGPGGVLAVPWDRAFFYVERRQRAALSRTATRLIRCFVLNDRGHVVDTFSMGRRIELAFDEDTAAGQQAMDVLYQNFEYYRRFMDEGPSSVPPVAELLSTEVSFRNSLKMQFQDVPDIVNSGHPLLWLLLAMTALPSLIQATMHYLAQLTCRDSVWPEAVERACTPTATEPEGLAS